MLNGHMIKVIRTNHKFGLVDFAGLADIGIGHLSEVERGNRKLAPKTEAKIVAALRQIGVIDEEIECVRKLLEVTK